MNDAPTMAKTKSETIRILLVEDDDGCARLLQIMLSRWPYGVCTIRRAVNLAAALQEVGQGGTDLVLLDLGLPDSQGLDTYVRMHVAAARVPIIVLTGMDDEDLAATTVQQGAQDYIVKVKMDSPSLARSIRYALERSHTQQTLVVEHDLLRSVMDNIPDQVYLKDPDSRFVSVNPATARFFGASFPDELVGKCDFDFFPRELAAQFLAEEQAILRGDQPCINREAAVTDTAGSMRWIWTTKVPLHDHTGNITGLLGLNRDITERKRAEEEARKTLRWHEGVNRVQQALLAAAPLADKLKTITDGITHLFDVAICRIWLIRPCDLCEHSCTHADVREGPYVCNYRKMCLHLLANSGRYTYTDGYSHRRAPLAYYRIGQLATGRDHKFRTNDVLHDPFLHNHQWARELGLTSFAGYQIRIHDGETAGVLALFATHPILSAEDAILDLLSSSSAFVVEQALAEEALKVAQIKLIDAAKMESVAQLAAGVAHEVKNPLAIALMGLEYLSNTVGTKDDEVAMALKDTQAAILQADNIIHELLSFAVPAKMELQLQDLNSIVTHSFGLVRHEARKRDITQIMNLGQDLPHLQLDSTKIEQVLVNLCMNAIAAMPNGGTLFIKTRANHRENATTEVIMEVEDTGTGIEEADLAKLFVPFFTKKQTGKGIGLGLTISKQIVEWHGGTIRIGNRPEGGSRATVTLKT